MAVLMKNGNDFNLLVARREVYGIREALEQATPDSWMNFWKLKRSGSDPLDKIIELIKESDPEAKSLHPRCQAVPDAE